MKKSLYPILGILLLALVAGAIASPVMPDFSIFGKNVGQTLRDLKINLGLDLRGGAHLVYKADMSGIPQENIEDSLAGARDVIERRVNAYGISEPQIVTNHSGGEYRIVVDLAGVDDVNAAIAMIGETPILDFREEKTEADFRLSPEEQVQAKKANAETEQKARTVLERAKNGEDFAALAREFSEDPGSKEQGGDLDFIKKGIMVEPFENVAFNPDFQKDAVWPELVHSSFGFHIIKKTDERGEGEDKEVRTSHILLATQDEEFRLPTMEEFQEPFKRTELTGKDLEQAQVIVDKNTQEPQVSIQFNDEGKRRFKEITERNVGKNLAIYLDGELVTAPVVQTIITDGSAVITGQYNIQEAKELAKRLNAGALPVKIEIVSQERVGAALGDVSLKQSLKAGLFGLGLVSGFMIVFYLAFGLVAVAALAFYAVLMTAIFKILGITLTLAGIAGFVLSLGMAVDANVLIFERVKEELRRGESLRNAIQQGFKRAWTSIRDGNISTLITCVILAGVGTGMVKGFAITLGIGVGLSMFTAVFVTRNLLEFLERIFKRKLIIGYKKIK